MSVEPQIIRFLAAGGFVSGQEIAARLGISRAAVNQHVCRLRDQGVEIHAVRGRGYRLNGRLEPLDVDLVSQALSGPAAQRDLVIEVVEGVDSTNRHIVRRRAAGDFVDVCLAEYQSAGRGRRGRVWLAAPFGSVLMSLAHTLVGGPSASAGLSLAAGIAAVRALDRCGCRGVGLKWPNDVMADGAKLGGILVEIQGELGERCTCVVGVGLNVVLPRAIAERCDQSATSVAEHVDVPVSRNDLAAALVSSLIEVLDQFNHTGFASFREEWESRHINQNQAIRVSAGSERVEGIARGVDDQGALLLERVPGGLTRITTGEVAA